MSEQCLKKMLSECILENVGLKNENKRYREALEFYADGKTYDSRAGLKIFRDSGRIAKKALGKK